METKETNISPDLLYCSVCMITCKRKCEWDRHIKTTKHIGNQQETSGNTNFAEILSCDCGKTYSNRSGLWKHKKKCGLDKPPDDKSSQIDTNLVFQVSK
jgi:hypothetical protein